MSVAADDLIAFWTARLDEVEAAAKAAAEDHPALEAQGGHWQDVGDRHVRYDNGTGEILRSVDVTGGPGLWYEQIWVRGDPDGAVAAHIALHDPTRVLREVAADRKLLDLCERAKSYRDQVFARPEPRSISDEMRAVTQMMALEQVLRLRAAVYIDHPDYRSEWGAA